jgi:hypothetical protein
VKLDYAKTHHPGLSGAHWFVYRYRVQPLPCVAGIWSAGSAGRHFHRSACMSALGRPVGQISPYKNVNFRDTTATLTLSPGSGAS